MLRGGGGEGGYLFELKVETVKASKQIDEIKLALLMGEWTVLRTVVRLCICVESCLSFEEFWRTKIQTRHQAEKQSEGQASFGRL